MRSNCRTVGHVLLWQTTKYESNPVTEWQLGAWRMMTWVPDGCLALTIKSLVWRLRGCICPGPCLCVRTHNDAGCITGWEWLHLPHHRHQPPPVDASFCIFSTKFASWGCVCVGQARASFQPYTIFAFFFTPIFSFNIICSFCTLVYYDILTLIMSLSTFYI